MFFRKYFFEDFRLRLVRGQTATTFQLEIMRVKVHFPKYRRISPMIFFGTFLRVDTFATFCRTLLPRRWWSLLSWRRCMSPILERAYTVMYRMPAGTPSQMTCPSASLVDIFAYPRRSWNLQDSLRSRRPWVAAAVRWRTPGRRFIGWSASFRMEFRTRATVAMVGTMIAFLTTPLTETSMRNWPQLGPAVVPQPLHHRVSYSLGGSTRSQNWHSAYCRDCT